MLDNNAVFAVILQPTGEVAVPACNATRAHAFAQQFNQLMQQTDWSAHVVPIVFKIESHLEHSRRQQAEDPQPSNNATHRSDPPQNR